MLTAPILVASDTTHGADAAIRTARALAAVAGAPVSVVSVLHSLPFVAGGMAMSTPEVCMPLDPSVEAALRGERRSRVQEQLRRLGAPDDWRVDIRVGAPASEIADAARELGAGLLVVGLTPHTLLDRFLGRENALAIVRASPVPVLAVAAELGTAPRRIVVGVDFTPASLSAAHAAFAFAGSRAMVQLLHVRESGERATEVFAEWYAKYQSALDGDFALLESQIEVPSGILVEHATLDGRVARKLLERAEQWDAELVVVTAHGGGFLRRLVVGSVTSEIIRRATRPVLVVPASTARLHAGEHRTVVAF
ncbi:MAG: universal stress protein [Gemmatimonadaceae bacterium]